jgi:hypothetical protein
MSPVLGHALPFFLCAIDAVTQRVSESFFGEITSHRTRVRPCHTPFSFFFCSKSCYGGESERTRGRQIGSDPTDPLKRLTEKRSVLTYAASIRLRLAYLLLPVPHPDTIIINKTAKKIT